MTFFNQRIKISQSGRSEHFKAFLILFLKIWTLPTCEKPEICFTFNAVNVISHLHRQLASNMTSGLGVIGHEWFVLNWNECKLIQKYIGVNLSEMIQNEWSFLTTISIKLFRTLDRTDHLILNWLDLNSS